MTEEMGQSALSAPTTGMNDTVNCMRSERIKVCIPQRLIDFGARFVKVAPRRKKAFEKGWDKDSNYAHDDKYLVEHLEYSKGNYGVLSWNGLCMFDIDNNEVFRGTGIKLPASFTVKRGDHGHYYFTCPDCPDDMREKHVLSFGDVRMGGDYYVVGPNSIHPSGDIYNVHTDNPIVDIPWSTICPIIEAHKIESDEEVAPASKKMYAPTGEWGDILGLRCEDIYPPVGKITVSGDIIKGDHPEHGSTNGGNYHINTATNEWKCHRHEHGGSVMSLYAISKGMILCQDYKRGCLIGRGEEIILALHKDGYDVSKLGTFAKIVIMREETRNVLKEWGL
jgi:hypothetical protein